MSKALKNVYDVTNITTMGDYPSKTDESIIIYATDERVYFWLFGERDNAGRSDFNCMLPTLYEAYKDYFAKDDIDDNLIKEVGYIAKKSLYANFDSMWKKSIYVYFTPQGVYEGWDYDSITTDLDINIRGRVASKIFQSIEDNTHPYIKKVEEGIYDVRASKYVSDDMLLLDKENVSMILFNDPETDSTSCFVKLCKVEGETTDDRFQNIANTINRLCDSDWEFAMPERERFIEESYLLIYGKDKACYANINNYISKYRQLASRSKEVANC